jgi:ornithine carbamoyltransferase
MPRHFLRLCDLSREELVALLERALELKRWRREGRRPPLFERRTLAMIFEKSSTRTRVSFEAAMAEGGGKAVFLSTHESQLGRGEPPEDTARVLAEMADAIMVRTFAHDIVERIAACARVPVINGLTNNQHPCQLLADLLTWFEHRGDIRGLRLVARRHRGEEVAAEVIDHPQSVVWDEAGNRLHAQKALLEFLFNQP